MKANRKNLSIQRVLLAGALILSCAPCLAQKPSGGLQSEGQIGNQTGSHPTNGTTPGNIGSSVPLGSASPLDGISNPFPDTSRQKRNDERQRRLVIDTQKLLALTGLLKSELASNGSEPMSPQMIKQMEEIEKLAKSVKDKMRD